MERIKCIPFDKKAQENLPQNIKDKIKANQEKSKLKKELKNYLNDLDNVIDTGHFPTENIEHFVFHHKDLNLRDFVAKGREYIRQYLMNEE